MNKFKINLVYSNNNLTIDEIIIKVLSKELSMICKNNKLDVTSSCTYLSREGGKSVREYK